MFIKNLLWKVHAFLRNDCPYDEWFKVEPNLVKFEPDLFDRDVPHPWYTRVYWAIVRFWSHHWLCNPADVYRNVKWFIQRGRRGWADCDTWSLDYYLNGWMPDALRHLKAHKHGTPLSVFPTDPEYIKDCGNPTDEAEAIAIARWDAIMDKMIAGFEASWRINDGLYEKELGEYPMRRPDGVSRDAWDKVKDDRMAASRLLEQRDAKIMEEGLALFIKFYHSLWD
jgi:hypothetical protein